MIDNYKFQFNFKICLAHINLKTEVTVAVVQVVLLSKR